MTAMSAFAVILLALKVHAFKCTANRFNFSVERLNTAFGKPQLPAMQFCYLKNRVLL